MFQINKTVKAIFLLAAAYTLGTFLTYNTFLQVRVYEDLPLMWQSVIQQSFLWILPISVLYITFSIISGKKPKKNIFEEQKLILPAFLTILITGIGIGVHAVAQVVEDALLGFQGTSLFELVYFIDETVGHALLLPANFVGIFFSLIEMNRDGSNLNKMA